jgi:hypothetical protein
MDLQEMGPQVVSWIFFGSGWGPVIFLVKVSEILGSFGSWESFVR